jgi:hypothetical protein
MVSKFCIKRGLGGEEGGSGTDVFYGDLTGKVGGTSACKVASLFDGVFKPCFR